MGFPILEVLKKKGFEVLLLTITPLKEFDGKKLVCISKEDSEFEETEDGKKARKTEAAAFSELYPKVKEVLGNLHAGLTM